MGFSDAIDRWLDGIVQDLGVLEDDEVFLRLKMLLYLEAITADELREVLRRLGSSWTLVDGSLSTG